MREVRVEDVTQAVRSPDDEVHEQTGRVLWPDRRLDPFVEGLVPGHLDLEHHLVLSV